MESAIYKMQNNDFLAANSDVESSDADMPGFSLKQETPSDIDVIEIKR